MITKPQIQQFRKLVEDVVLSLNLSKGAAQYALSSKKLQPRMKEVIRALAQDMVATMSLADLITAGKYDGVHIDITQGHFPVTGQASEAEPVLVHLGRTASTDEVLLHLDKPGLRPATIVEFLAFVAKNPDEQRTFPIVALGSVWVNPFGGRHVVCLLAGCGRERYLGLCRYDDGWGDRCWFIAFPK